MIGIGIGIWIGGRAGGGAVPSQNLSSLSDDGYGGWDWSEPGSYGLTDDGSGGWDWSAPPSYRLNSTTLEWE